MTVSAGGMREKIDQPQWVREQYINDANLNARIALHKRFSTSKIEWTAWVYDQIMELLSGTADRPLNILEIGAGPGNLWSENGHRFPPYLRLTISDLSQGMVEAARRNLSASGVQHNAVLTNAEALPFTDNHFHAVVANHMLYHVPDRDRALADIRRVLVAGGVLIAATNGDQHMSELHDLVQRFEPAYEKPTNFSRKFSLESGVEQLAVHFDNGTVVEKENELLVTEAEPLVDYLLSGLVAAKSHERRDELREFVEQELQRSGEIRITPITGLLIGTAG